MTNRDKLNIRVPTYLEDSIYYKLSSGRFDPGFSES